MARNLYRRQQARTLEDSQYLVGAWDTGISVRPGVIVDRWRYRAFNEYNNEKKFGARGDARQGG